MAERINLFYLLIFLICCRFILNVTKSTYGREIARNSDIRNGKYKPALAQRKVEYRIEKKYKVVRFTKEIKTKAKDLLKKFSI